MTSVDDLGGDPGKGLWSLAEVAERLGAQLIGNASVTPRALSLDTRTIQPGDAFVALRAARDGHEFASMAAEKGAGVLVVDHELDIDCPQLVVPDTQAALQDWGRIRLEAARPRIVFGVTGSVGKTSTKDLLASATGAWKTPGNRNNTLGVPQALAVLPEGLDTAVLEMGMSTPGEIHRLTEIAPPDIAVITNVGTAHMENFPDGSQGIARAKGEIVEGLKVGGAWVHLASDAWCHWIALQPWARRARAVSVGSIAEGCSLGWDAPCSLGARGEAFRLKTAGSVIDIHLKLRGEHQIRNAALAGVAASLAGFDIEDIAKGLGALEAEPGRGRLHALDGGGWLLDETYNASQDSILACAKAVLDLEGGPAVAVLGCMRELGDESERIHRQTGEGLKALGLDRVLVYGDHARALASGFGPGASAFPDFDALREDPAGLGSLAAGDRILVKGSRYWQSERAVAWLLARQGSTIA